MDIGGSIVALVTPFRDGKVDATALEALVELHVESCSAGVVPCGTTGESATLSHEEHEQVVRIVAECSAHRVPVIAGTGSNSTAEAVRLTRAAVEADADGILLIMPYYNRPGQEGIYRHVCEVAGAAKELPIILYNIPSRTGVSLAPETLARLAKVARIRGLKEASGSLSTAMDFQDAAPQVALIAGDDALTLPILAIGGTGVISVAANVVPEEMVSLVEAGRRGDLAAARKTHQRLLPLFRALFAETNPIPVKAAMELLGRCSAEVRLPLTAATPETRARLDKVLRELKALK